MGVKNLQITLTSKEEQWGRFRDQLDYWARHMQCQSWPLCAIGVRIQGITDRHVILDPGLRNIDLIHRLFPFNLLHAPVSQAHGKI